MKSHKLTSTDDQIEADVLAKRDDLSAWEALPFVPPSRSQRPDWMLRNKHLDLAAKFHVLSVLHHLGVEANLSLAQPDGVDIAILGKTGLSITIDVKTVGEGAHEWPVDQFSARKHHYVALVEFSSQEGSVVAQPHTYVVASEALQELVYRRKLCSISLDVLRQELAAFEAWQLIVSAQAA